MTAVHAVVLLAPDEAQKQELAAYMARYAEAGSWLVQKIFDSGITDQVRLHRQYYGDLRERFDLPSQTAVLCLKQVAKLCRRAVAPPKLGDRGPVPYDRHLYRLRSIDSLSLTGLSGRLVVPCSFQSYGMGKLPFAEAELTRADHQWRFAMRTTLSDAALQQDEWRRETDMSDKLLNRITRLVSGITHNVVGQAEQATAVPVMEQAIRDIDEAVGDVRSEIGQQEATKHNIKRRLRELHSEHDLLDERISLAVADDKEELAEAGVGRQLDIEDQLTLLERTLGEADGEISKLSDSLSALQASRREAAERLRDLKSAPPPSEAGGRHKGSKAGAKALTAIESAGRLGESLTGIPADAGQANIPYLDELAELHRTHAVQERLAATKARLKALR